MRATKQDLISFGLFDNLPQPLKEMADGYYFVFYYKNDEDSLKLNVYEYNVVKQVNVSLYRDMDRMYEKYKLTSSPNVGFFSNTFETRDGLFFLFLKTYNDADKVLAFYRYAKGKDEIIDLNVSTNAVNEIYNSDDFRRAMSYFSEVSLQPVTLVYDMVNDVFKKKLSKSLYGSTIKKVVTLVKFDGGVLPEINGRLRFMVIGENANLTEEQRNSLVEAKLLSRSLTVSMDDIYLHTGWVMGDKDGKWRTNISDDKAELSGIHLFDYNGRKLYVPNTIGATNENIEQVLYLVNKPNNLYAMNYRGRLIDILEHPTLFEYYPQLATLPVIYYFGDKIIYDTMGKPIEMFYQSSNERGGYIVINGSKISGSSLSILLHEIQHSVQRIEGFARGGNQFLAQFVASVGSSSVRKIFSCINRMERYFRDSLVSDEERIAILDILNNQIPKSNESAGTRQELLRLLDSMQSYRDNYKTVNFYLVIYIAEEGDISTSDLVIYLQEKVGDIVFELFENITEGYESAKNYMKQLLKEGYRTEDISMILFKGYENLYGELESRSVQESRLLGSEFKNYFYLTKWENAPIQQITVIDGVEKIFDCEKIQAAVEDKDGDYILHFQVTDSCEPFLHELGHIVKDALVELGYGDKIEAEADKEFSEVEEFFISKFLQYLKTNIEDDKLRKDLRYHFTKENEVMNNILYEFFLDVEVSDRLKFLQTMLSV